VPKNVIPPCNVHKERWYCYIHVLVRFFWAINSCVVMSRHWKIFLFVCLIDLVSCADRCGRPSKTHMTFARWNLGVAYSIPAQGMDMYDRCSSLLRWDKWFAFVNMVMNTRFPYSVINLLAWWEFVILLKMTASGMLASRHFRWADPTSTEFYKMSLAKARSSEFFLNSNKVKGFVHESLGRKLCRSNTILQYVERL